MADTLTPEERSRRMSLVRGRDTKPEMIVRRLAHSMGYRYRLHRRDLPGCPDMVFPSRHKVIFIHGCFWHRHEDPSCPLTRMPKSRHDFWKAKFNANKARDNANQKSLLDLGWSVLVIWECELRDRNQLERRISEFLE